jgi:hypothetical protein
MFVFGITLPGTVRCGSSIIAAMYAPGAPLPNRREVRGEAPQNHRRRGSQGRELIAQERLCLARGEHRDAPAARS